MGLGRASVDELTPEDLVIPPGFSLTLGEPTAATAGSPQT
jgi:hypothetical protein